MRPIKYRLWDGTKMVPVTSIEFFEDGGYRVNDTDLVPQLMQYTGINDRNGVQIYESDIVIPWRVNSRHTKYPAKVRIRLVEWKTTDSNRGLTRTGFNIAGGDLEVVGNMYENPELINTPKED